MLSNLKKLVQTAMDDLIDENIANPSSKSSLPSINVKPKLADVSNQHASTPSIFANNRSSLLQAITTSATEAASDRSKSTASLGISIDRSNHEQNSSYLSLNENNAANSRNYEATSELQFRLDNGT